VSSDTTALGDRMKRYEAPYRALLPRRTYTVLRVDGRAFHTYLRGAVRPFDEAFAADMDAVAAAMCKEITGAFLAYVQSDEISIVAADFRSTSTEPWFGGVVAKWTSIGAAIATAELNARRPGRRALFDARVFTLSDPVEVANYLVWRQRDATRNSIVMAGQAHFPHRSLHGQDTGQIQERLWAERGVNWNRYPDGFKRGRVATRVVGFRDSEHPERGRAPRSWWAAEPAPVFIAEPGSWLARTIPTLPTLAPAPPCGVGHSLAPHQSAPA
jgi:tRNA(His) 5'-end guanylyltransferase